jgi:hypothetical protein
MFWYLFYEDNDNAANMIAVPMYKVVSAGIY